MPHYHSLDDIRLQVSWLTIGVFDGVHLGHQEIVRRLVSGAHRHGIPAVVLTFHPHPETILNQRSDIRYLTLPEEKANLLDMLGIDIIITHPFTEAFSNLSAETFMTENHHRLGVQQLWIGHDFALGHNRQGNAVHLSALGKALDFTVKTIGPVKTGNRIISSRQIRTSLALGSVDEARADLGRFYTLTGKVVHGDGRGRKINIPTANLEVPTGKLIPAHGVYACWATILDQTLNRESGRRFRAVTNIGTRPTFTAQSQSTNVEIHLLEFDEQLYGQELQVEFVTRLREERKYASASELIKQIHRDVSKAREIL